MLYTFSHSLTIVSQYIFVHDISFIYLTLFTFHIFVVPITCLSKRHLPIILATTLQPSHVRVLQQGSLAQSLFRLVHFYPRTDFLFIAFLDKTFASHYHARALSLRGGYAQPRQVQTRKLCLSRAPSALYTKVPATCSRN